MKTKVILLGSALLFSMFLGSCSSEDEYNNPESGEIELDNDELDPFSMFAVWYNDSTISTIGAMHNQCMDSIAANYVQMSTLPNYLHGYCFRRGTISNSHADSVRFFSEMHSVIYTENGIPRTLENPKPISSDVPQSWNKYIDQFEEIIESGDTTMLALQNFASIKSDIIRSSTITDTDRACLLCIGEIAQASYEYNIVGETISFLLSRAERVVEADMAGAASSVAAGVASGKYVGLLIFGPEGVVSAVAADAFLGAVMSSSWALITCWF